MRKRTASTPVQTKCLACGKQVTETIGRLAKKPEPRCAACGGKLDSEPLGKLLLGAVEDLKAIHRFSMKRGDLPKK